MMKRFEGVFRRFEEHPTSFFSQEALDLINRPGNEASKAKFDELPIHQRQKTSGSAFAAQQDIMRDVRMPLDEGAQMKLEIKIEQDTIRLTVEAHSSELTQLTQMEQIVKRHIENHYGKFTDISSGMAKK